MPKFSFVAVAILLSVICSVPAAAQWLPNPYDYNNPTDITFGKNVGIGVGAHSTMRLRLSNPPVTTDTTGSGAQLAFGTPTAVWWSWRLDSSNHLYLDRQNNGWKNGLALLLDGRMGLNTATPQAQLEVLTSSNLAQLTLGKDAAAGAISAYVNGADSMAIGFDARFQNGNWIAEHVNIGILSKNSSRMKISGAVGNTVGSPIQTLTDHLVVDIGNSRVGVGTASPAVLLANTSGNVNDGSTGMSTRSLAWQTAAAGYTAGIENTLNGSTAHGLLLKTNSTTGAFILNAVNSTSSILTVRANGLVGINTNNPSKPLHVVGDAQITGTLTTGAIAPTSITSTGAVTAASFSTTGNLSVGNITATGSITAGGSITGATVVGAIYQDLAEWVPASEDMTPGTVVVLDPTTNNQVMPSHRSYDTTVAGVVSAQPGLILGVGAATKEQVATTGRVKVKVDATRGAIAIGDILVTSDRPGMAMKSQPIDLGGIAIHRPGTVIGKALEPLAKGEGEILVLLSLQ